MLFGISKLTAYFNSKYRATVSSILDAQLAVTGSAYHRCHTKALKAYAGDMSLYDICNDVNILVPVIRKIYADSSAPKSAWNRIQVLRGAMSRWIKRNRLPIPNPVALIIDDLQLRPETGSRDAVPSREQYKNLLRIANEHLVPQDVIDLIECCYESGLRVREVLSWRVENLHMTLRMGNSGKLVEQPYIITRILKQKRRKEIEIPISPRLWQILTRRVAGRETGNVWPWKNPPYKILKRTGIMRIAGMENFRPFHDYRKCFATDLADRGISTEVACDIQGHATVSAHAMYVKEPRRRAEQVHRDSWADYLKSSGGIGL